MALQLYTRAANALLISLVYAPIALGTYESDWDRMRFRATLPMLGGARPPYAGYAVAVPAGFAAAWLVLPGVPATLAAPLAARAATAIALLVGGAVAARRVAAV